jgi:hypothetical protein
MEALQENAALRGFFRLQIREADGRLAGDSNQVENVIVNEGRRVLARLLGALAGSSQMSHAALGSGTEPGAADTSLNLELAENKRATVAAQTNGSTSVQFTFSFLSSNSFVTATRSLSNVGLFFTSSGGTIFAGNTFASSTCATNQNVYGTYTITF